MSKAIKSAPLATYLGQEHGLGIYGRWRGIGGGRAGYSSIFFTYVNVYVSFGGLTPADAIGCLGDE